MEVVRGAFLQGIQAVSCQVEVAITAGIPGMVIVGMADTCVLESRNRIRCALKAAGYQMPRFKITINLLPADLRKHSSVLDLAIAVAILRQTHQIQQFDTSRYLLAGELGLEGDVKPLKGLYAFGCAARSQGLTLISGSAQTQAEAAYGGAWCPHIAALRQGVDTLPPISQAPVELVGTAEQSLTEVRSKMDFGQVFGQEYAKRASMISVLGKHGLVMVGPPGAGKTMLAQRLPSIMAPLDPTSIAQLMLIYGVAHQDCGAIEAGIAPFRAPHHSCSVAGLIGGGSPVRPGEVSLAHHGVLFMDEVAEFQRPAIQALRQPLEEKQVRIIRQNGVSIFPCDFLLCAASNRCPCGALGDDGKTCRCTTAQVNKYQGKIEGAFGDRIALHLDVFKPDPHAILQRKPGLTSAEMREALSEAIGFRKQRLAATLPARDTAGETLFQAYGFSSEAVLQFQALAARLHLGGRSIASSVRVSRTIADLDLSEQVLPDHCLEAVSLRTGGR